MAATIHFHCNNDQQIAYNAKVFGPQNRFVSLGFTTADHEYVSVFLNNVEHAQEFLAELSRALGRASAAYDVEQANQLSLVKEIEARNDDNANILA